MKFSFDLWSVLFLCAASQGYFLSAALFWQRREGRRSRRILAALVLCISVLLTETLLFKSGLRFVDDHRYFIFLSTPVIYLIGPLYYLYARSLFRKEAPKNRLDALHFLPAMICTFNYLPAYLLLLGFKPLPFMPLTDSIYFPVWISGYVDMGLNTMQTGIYVFATLRLLKIHQSQAENMDAGENALYIDWLKKLTICMLLLLSGFAVALMFFLMNTYVASIENVLALCRAAVIYAVGYIAIKQPESLVVAANGKGAGKYQHSPLSTEQAGRHAERLLRLMQEEKPYLNSNLKLPELANRLSLSTNHLSQVLNQNLGVNFFDFVNQYRVKEVQGRLLNPEFDHLTNLAIAFDAGFSSKASFNRAFKKHAGETPSQFIKTHRILQQVQV